MIAATPNAGFDPALMQQKMQQALEQADVNNSSSLSKTEAQDALSGKGLSEAMFDKAFNNFDANGDGELSQQEQQDMLAKMQERMPSMQAGGLSGTGQADSQSLFESLLESLSSDEEDNEQKSEFDEMLERLREQPDNLEVQRDAAALINSSIPPVNTYA